MRYWDSSALVPLLVGEPSTLAALAAFASDPEIVTWWASGVECVSALARLERESNVAPAVMDAALHRLDSLAAAWQEVQPVAPLRRTAYRILRVHPLRAGDALQLAAAIAAAEDTPASLPFVTLDDRLAVAAAREGFVVVMPGRDPQ